MELSHLLLVEGTREMLTSWLAYKNTSSLEHSIWSGMTINLWSLMLANFLDIAVYLILLLY